MSFKYLKKIVLIVVGMLILNSKVVLADQQYNYKYGYDWWLSNNDYSYPGYDGGPYLWDDEPAVPASFPKTYSESLQSGKKISNQKGQWVDAPKGFYIAEKGWTNNLGADRYNEVFKGNGIPFSNSSSYSHPKASAHGSSYWVGYDAHHRGGNDSGPWQDSVLNTYKGYYYHVYRQPKPHKSYAKPIDFKYQNGNDYWYKKGKEIGIETNYHDAEGGVDRRWARLYTKDVGGAVRLSMINNSNLIENQIVSSLFSSARATTISYDNSNMVDRWYATSNAEGDYTIGSLAYNDLAYSVDDTESDKEGYNIRVDGTGPEIKCETEYEWSAKDIDIEISAGDSGSGIKEIKVYDDQGIEISSGVDSLSLYVSEEGVTKYLVEAYDNVGNKSTKTISVRIDTIAPDGEVNYDYDEDKFDMEISVNKVKEEGSGVAKIWVEYFPVGDESNIVSQTLVESKGTYKGKNNLYDIFPDNIDVVGMVVKAIDKVGNERILSEKEVDVFKIEATINRVWPPYEAIFKEGEQGVVNVKVYGGVDEVVITFPEELTKLDYTLDTDIFLNPKKKDSIEHKFFIPFESEKKEYKVEVKGYKNNKEKVVYPSMEVKGNILSKVRTRIR
ncbi:hypothetical protein [Clostridium gasigenes]|uniref:Ig-like domain (Group 3) n=1 Tax=Clostridium gasigenes TaxID=94869 RepID=A0A7X0SFG8_9CLOT|nr:hypothetical protein [Clostridium gasigenes]MBB6716638.1 hypothetical protein [Clostridium gasigenes]